MKQTKDKVAEIQISYLPAISSKPIITSAQGAYDQLTAFFPAETICLQERFVAMYLNRANRVLGVYELSKGGMTGTVVDIRLLLSVALKIAATGIILCHNHPSGNLQPSNSDRDITNKIREACKLFDINLLDHMIIVAGGTYFSFAEEGFC